MMQAAGPQRRRCAICLRGEATHTLYLASIRRDGHLARACRDCRGRHGVTWRCGICRTEQAGARHHRGGLVLCTACAALADLPD